MRTKDQRNGQTSWQSQELKRRDVQRRVFTAQMKENQGFPMSNNGSISKSQPWSAAQYQQQQQQPMALWVPNDEQQKEVGEDSDKLSQIQNQCPKLNRDLEWQNRRANGTFHHRLQCHICDNFHFFGGKPTDGNSLCCLPWARPALYRCFKPNICSTHVSLPAALTFLPFWGDKRSGRSLWMFPCGWWTQTAHTLF